MSKYLFILGAGASKPYGYPTGDELKWKIINELSNCNGLTFEALKEDFLDGRIKEFASSFRASKLNSIDAFLRMNHDFESIGKLAIAVNILQAQTSSNLDPANQDWFGYLYNRLIGTEEERLNNPDISFITFNYDHSLEHQLYNSFKHSFKLSEERVRDVLKKIKVHHVYGDIGELASPLNQHQSLVEYFHYHNYHRYNAIKHASDHIKVMYSQREAVPKEVSDLQSSENIYILGFGFEKLNIDRLGFKWNYLRNKVRATGYGLTGSEKTAAISAMDIHPNKITFGHSAWDCYTLLRESLG